MFQRVSPLDLLFQDYVNEKTETFTKAGGSISIFGRPVADYPGGQNGKKFGTDLSNLPWDFMASSSITHHLLDSRITTGLATFAIPPCLAACAGTVMHQRNILRSMDQS